MKPKNTRFTVIMVVFVVVFIIMPYFNRNKMARPGATKSTIQRLTAYWQDNKLTPEELVEVIVRENDITFLGEVGKFHESAAFVNSVVPSLRDYGVNIIATSYLNNSDQNDIDRLIMGETFDQSLAKDLLFRNLVMNGYQEYYDFLKAVWQVNQNLSDGVEPLKLLGLNVEQNWSVLRTSKDAENPEIIKMVYAKGVPDTYMANVVKKEIIDKNKKAFIFTGFQHSLSSLRIEAYEEKMIENGFPRDVNRMAWIVKQQSSVSSATIVIHAPWSVEKSKYGIDYPLGGVLDSFMEEYDMLEQRMGLLTEDTPFGNLPSAPGSFGTKNSHTLSEFCDGYILLGPIKGYTPFTAIPDFITTSNFGRAVEFFPGPKEVMPASPRELNEYIAGIAANVSQILEKFEK
jgi:hypothetical protein